MEYRNNIVTSIIAKALGGFWILDGLLQFQPQMFGSNFITQILDPNLSNQPTFIHELVTYGIYLWSLNPALCDVGAGLLQIAIGALLFFRPSDRRFRFGLYLSIVWGIIVWFCGEGAGLMFTGSASFYTGAPGGVLLYVLLAIVLLMSDTIDYAWLPRIASWTLLLGAALQVQNTFWSAEGIQGSLMASTMEPLHALQVIPLHIVNMLSIHPFIGNAILMFLPLAIGLLLFFKPNRFVAIISLVFLFLVWWWGEDFGMLTTLITGTSTDPNSAPLMALFLIPIFFQTRRDTTRNALTSDLPVVVHE